MHVTDNAM